MVLNAQRSEESKQALIEAARSLFGQNGYAATSTPSIAEAAGVSRGALYHHFVDKEDLFRCVVEAEYQRVEDALDRTVLDVTDPLEALIEGGDGFIEAMSDPLTRQIILVDGASVLGTEALRLIDNRTTTGSLRDGIVAAQAKSRLPNVPASALASLMSGAYDRAVLDGFGSDAEGRLAMQHAIRLVWRALSRLP